MHHSTQQTFDAIVIGSGIGGLATASFLAQLGRKRVLVLERHFKLGGFTHSFRRDKYEWDVGVHYVGEMYDGAMTRQLMDLATGGGVHWHRMSALERVIFPEGTFDIPGDPEEFQQRLVERFPAERSAIDQYFKDVRRAQGWIARWFIAKQYPAPVGALLTGWGRSLVEQTTEAYLARFHDPLLRAILAAQWPDFGSPPKESAFGFHATVAGDFFRGGYYPVGGAKELANGMAAQIRQHGGECYVSHDVQEVLIEGGLACGVRVAHKGAIREYRAPLVISDAGAATTFGKLVEVPHCLAEKHQLSRVKSGTSALILFLGLKDDPQSRGFTDTNYWLYDRLDHDPDGRAREGKEPGIDGTFVSFGSLRNPGQNPHVAQIITFGSGGEWLEFAGTEWMRRGDKYDDRKMQVAEEMLDFSEKYLPGLRSLIAYQELSTPLTVESFTNHRQGMVYGQVCDANRLFRDRWSIRTSLPGLFLTGSDVGTPGVNGALMAAVMTAAKLLGTFGLPRLMTRAYTASRK